MISTAGLALAPAPTMIVHSDLLGPLSVASDEVLEFPDGLFGFPECRSFVLVPAEREGLYWLQSSAHSTLAFLLVDPFLFFEDFAVDVSRADLADLAAEDATEIAILAIVTLPGSRQDSPTANLQGPLALNLRGRRAKQLAVSESDFGVRCPIDLMSGAPRD